MPEGSETRHWTQCCTRTWGPTMRTRPRVSGRRPGLGDGRVIHLDNGSELDQDVSRACILVQQRLPQKRAAGKFAAPVPCHAGFDTRVRHLCNAQWDHLCGRHPSCQACDADWRTARWSDSQYFEDRLFRAAYKGIAALSFNAPTQVQEHQEDARHPCAVYPPRVRHGLDIGLERHEHVIEVDHHIDAEDYLHLPLALECLDRQSLVL